MVTGMSRGLSSLRFPTRPTFSARPASLPAVFRSAATVLPPDGHHSIVNSNHSFKSRTSTCELQGVGERMAKVTSQYSDAP